MQRKLSQWATADPTKRFVDLYSLLCNDVWLRVAHHKVNSNRGRETAGIDWQSMSHFNGDLDGNLERLRVMLKAKTFEPIPVRRVDIPKAQREEKALRHPDAVFIMHLLPRSVEDRTPSVARAPGEYASVAFPGPLG